MENEICGDNNAGRNNGEGGKTPRVTELNGGQEER